MSVLNSLKLKHSYHKIYFKELICLGIMFTLVKEEEEKEEEEEEETKQKTIKLASTF
jgi:glucose uptake protein GlcU